MSIMQEAFLQERSVMLTLREVRQRLSLINARIQFDKEYGEYRVTLQEWPVCARRTEDKAYYTNDLEDALFTAQDMRREANFYGTISQFSEKACISHDPH
jgi:hypothetical protein